ncbi:MAG: hypothetical protein V2I97_01750 [Desulfococcaceae bacterium]|jgi:hypothetical protein|nr:hypothetical protein [Desulfococcaceae bacterium]
MTAEKTDAVTFITEHRDIILPLYAETGSPKKTYDSLADGKLPEVKQIAFATFKQYLPVFAKVSDRLRDTYGKETDRIRRENENLKSGMEESREKIRILEKENAELRQENRELKNRPAYPPDRTDTLPENAPSHVEADGSRWGVQYKKPYFRLFKKVGTKTKWIHIGREWDTEKAQTKIREKEKQLGIDT